MAKKKSGSTKKKRNHAKKQGHGNERQDVLNEQKPPTSGTPASHCEPLQAYHDACKKASGSSPEDRTRTEAYAALVDLLRVMETTIMKERDANPPEINWKVPTGRPFWSETFKLELLPKMPRVWSVFDDLIARGSFSNAPTLMGEALRLDLPCFRCFTCGCVSCANLLVDECSCFLTHLYFAADNLFMTLKQKRKIGALGLGADVCVDSIRRDVAAFHQRCVNHRGTFMASCQLAFGRNEEWAAFIGEDEASPAADFFVHKDHRRLMAANSAWQRSSPHAKELECIGRTISAAYKILFDGICAQLLNKHHNSLLPWKPLKRSMKKTVMEMKDKCNNQFMDDLDNSIDTELLKDGDFYW